MKQMSIAVRALATMTLLTGFLYTGFMTLLSQVLFPHQSNGSMIVKDGKVIGSELIAQKFVKETYFWPRPSSSDYRAVPSGASNLGPTSSDLKKQVDERAIVLQKANPQNSSIPSEMLFASGSGLDPHISPASAEWQVRRIAQARKMSEESVREIVKQNTQRRKFGFLGEPTINVLRVNLDLDKGIEK